MLKQPPQRIAEIQSKKGNIASQIFRKEILLVLWKTQKGRRKKFTNKQTYTTPPYLL